MLEELDIFCYLWEYPALTAVADFPELKKKMFGQKRKKETDNGRTTKVRLKFKLISLLIHQ